MSLLTTRRRNRGTGYLRAMRGLYNFPASTASTLLQSSIYILYIYNNKEDTACRRIVEIMWNAHA